MDLNNDTPAKAPVVNRNDLTPQMGSAESLSLSISNQDLAGTNSAHLKAPHEEQKRRTTETQQ